MRWDMSSDAFRWDLLLDIGNDYIGHNYIACRLNLLLRCDGMRAGAAQGRPLLLLPVPARAEGSGDVCSRCIRPTYMVMAYIVMAYIAMAYIVMAYIVMACTVMAYIVMSYMVMAWRM